MWGVCFSVVVAIQIAPCTAESLKYGYSEYTSSNSSLSSCRSPSLPTSEDLPEPPRETREDHQSHEEKLLAQSYSRLAQMSLTPFTQGGGGGAGGEDRWHDWFRMQREWSENIDSSNQNYFDDGL